ncbi:HAAS signaling domain-containing protein [Staphylococcus shinii]|uniref:HAAS signaling domain-containing protein n=1 Tax=Staphylococcus shinii TaxID=2912228 RepID=UPI003CE9472F
MTKDEYIATLNRCIKRMNKEDKKDILNEYESHFISGYKDKKNDEEIIRGLGDPIDISKEINAMNALNIVEKEKSIKNIFIATFSIMGLSVFNFIVIGLSLFIFLLLLPFIIAYIIAVPVMLSSPIILFIIGIINGFDTITVSDVFEVIKGVILGVILGLIGYYFVKNFFKFIIFYLKWNLNTLKRESL